MAQLAALVVSPDEDFRQELGRLLRAGGVPVGLLEGSRTAAEQVQPDLVLVQHHPHEVGEQDHLDAERQEPGGVGEEVGAEARRRGGVAFDGLGGRRHLHPPARKEHGTLTT